MPEEAQSVREVKSVSQDAAGAVTPDAHPVEFPPLEPATGVKPELNINMLLDVNLEVAVRLGTTTLPIKDLLKMGVGSVVELQHPTNQPVDILVNDRVFAKGDIVVVDERFGVRITEILNPRERLGQLG
jgi:flagellar motor switch protein FliN/FliY